MESKRARAHALIRYWKFCHAESMTIGAHDDRFAEKSDWTHEK